MATVYLAEDLKHHRQVAIKVLRPEVAAAIGAERFLREIEIAARLQHPHILPLFDSGKAAGFLYYVMPFVEGESLRSRLNREQQLPLADALQLTGKVADALSYAHSHDVVHRDIKPENIMLSGGHALVADFGIARAITAAGSNQLTGTGIAVGTPTYMSPEQAAGEARLDGRSDLYSLGCVLYEMLAGEPPFRGPTAQAVIAAHFTATPKPIADVRSDVPPEIAEVIARALAKEPNSRLPTAAEFRDAMGTRASATAPHGHPLRAVGLEGLAAGAVLGKHHTVGREKERADLQAGFESAAAGKGLILSVAGEPGIGKTTLVEDFLAELNAAGRSYYIGRGRCSERLAGSEPYLPFLEALESLLRSEPGVVLGRTMKLAAPTWYVHIRPHSADDSSAARPLEDVQVASQKRMERELGAFFQEVSRLRPLILFFDDLHWADASTVDLLSYLGTKLDSMRLLMVVSYRPTDLLLTKHPFSQVKLDLQARGVCRELTLEFLSLGDIAAYLALEFPEHRFPVQFAAIIHAKTEGSPLFIVDLVQYLRDRQVIRQEGGRWTLAETVPDIERDLPESVRSMIQRKTEQLNDEDRHLLLAASVQGYEFDSAVVARVLTMNTAETEERLETLERVHAFVRAIGEAEFPDDTVALRFRFVHILYQNALYASLTPTRRSLLSAAVAEALLGYYGEEVSHVVSKLAFLFEVARDFSRASHYFLLAATYAAQTSAHRETLVLARHGLDLLKRLPTSRERDRQELDLLKIQGGSLLVLKGYSAIEVAETYERARELCDGLADPAELFGVLRGLWLHHLLRADLPTTRQLAAELLRIARSTQDSALVVLAHHAAGLTFLFQGKHLQACEHLKTGIATYDRQRHGSLPARYGAYDLAVACRIFLAVALWYRGYPDQSLSTIEEAVALAKQLKHPYSLAAAYFFSAWIHIDRREPELVRNCADACMKVADEEGFAFQSAHGRVVQGWALAEQGLLDEGLGGMRRGIAEYRATGAENERPHLLALLATAYGRRGQTQDALSAIEEALAVVNKTGLRFNEAELQQVKGELLLALASENTLEADACLHQAIEIAKRQSARSLELRAVTSLSRLYQRQGKKREARQMLAESYDWFTEGFDTGDLKEARSLLNELS
jgi:predicted ATPase